MANRQLKTQWELDNKKITLKEILKICKEKSVQKISIDWINNNVKILNTLNESRVQNANLSYPIIILNSYNNYSILDGNHRFAKAKQNNLKYISAYIIDILNIPEEKQEIFL